MILLIWVSAAIFPASPPRFHLVSVGTRKGRNYTGSMLRDALPNFLALSKPASSGEQAIATASLLRHARMDEPVSKRPHCAPTQRQCHSLPHHAWLKQPPSRIQAHARPQPPSAAQADLYESRAAACALPKPARISAACA